MQRVLAQDDTIIFVGSGISRWSGLPSWEKLIEELADYLEDCGLDATLVRQEASARDLLQAASYGFLKLTPPQIATFVRNTSGAGKAVPSAVHEAIMALGPRCFITTNYDDLIEQAYRQHQPALPEPHVVLNTQLLEQAEIIHAQARQFIFKPHGDARHADSIVLTREQYRKLLPEGPFSATLNTFKTLLQSRPVLFLGFGLRDPDFLFLRDLLANIYRGGMRDHYAIVADPLVDQEDYWRRHYGIHLIGYATTDQGRDHSGLLSLLEKLRSKPDLDDTSAAFDTENPAAILAVARYAAACLTPSAPERFVIHVSSNHRGRLVDIGATQFDHWPVERLLREGPERFILLGEPGTGKSFAIREAVNALASELQDACLRGELHTAMRIPIAIDLKLYNGDLESLIRGRFPQGLSFEELSAAFPVCLYLDSYNEMPRAYREDGSFDRQLNALIETRSGLGLVVGSRTSDGLDQIGLPVYQLSEISAEEVERRLAATGVTLPQNYQHDIIDVLKRPFYFRLMNRAMMSLDKIQTPGDLYAQFIRRVATRFAETFGAEIDITSALQRHAYATLEHGIEAFAISDLETAIAAIAPQLAQMRLNEIANWLASEEIIIPMREHRAAFVHQSLTEFLAASELKIQLEQQAGDVDTLINLRRWDNAIFLTLSMLDKPRAAALLGEITERDVNFALDAARFVQHGGEAVIGDLLEILITLPEILFDYDTRFAFDRLPFTPSHEPALRRILKVPALRGEAFGALAKALGRAVKQELIECLFEEGASWTAEEIGRALTQLIEPSDLATLVARLARGDVESLDDERGVTHRQVSAIAQAVSDISPEELKLETLDRLDTYDPSAQRIIAALICKYFADNKWVEALAMVLEMVRARLASSLFALYLNVRYEPETHSLFLEALDDQLFDSILFYVDQGDRWSIELLESCSADDSFRRRISAAAITSSGIRRHILDYCATGDPSALFSALEAWSSQGVTTEERTLLQAIDISDLDWSGRHDLLVATLARHNLESARLILGSSIPPDITGLDSINMGDVEPWLDWIIELTSVDLESVGLEAYWVASALAVLVAHSSASNNKAQLLKVLDGNTSAKRLVVAKMILPYMEGLSISDFSSQALTFLKNLILLDEGISPFRPHVFALIADETFLRDEIVPLAAQSSKAHYAVTKIIREAGKRLGIRVALPPYQDSSDH